MIVEEKDLYIGLGCSVILNIFLVILIVFFAPQCRREHLEEIDWECHFVDSEEMAINLAGACLKLDYDVNTEQYTDYEAEAVYNELSNEWIVTFTPKDLDENKKSMVVIRRDNKGLTILQNACVSDIL